jgi:uncharacterized delta-60 repeat protein
MDGGVLGSSSTLREERAMTMPMGQRLMSLVAGAALVLAACAGQDATETPLSPSPNATPGLTAPSSPIATPQLTAAPALPGPGDLDPTFGVGGLVTTDISGSGSDDHASAVALDREGRIVVLGWSEPDEDTVVTILVRYEQDGRLDQGFGIGGIATPGFRGSAMAIDADGRIMVAGTKERGFPRGSDFAVARYTNDGTLDPSYGQGGLVITDFPGARSEDRAWALTIDAQGRLVVAGFSGTNELDSELGDSLSPPDFALARYTANGNLDATFGHGGFVTADFADAGGDDTGRAVAVDADGRIVVAGDTGYRGGDDFPALARFAPDGNLDRSFGDGGRVTTDVPPLGSDEGHSIADIAITADGGIVAVMDDYVVGYTADGRLDARFGNRGLVTTNMDGVAIAVDSDGRILVSVLRGGFGVARYNVDGTPDLAFGRGGLATTEYSGVNTFGQGWAIAIDADGRIVVAGASESGSDSDTDFALARYVGSP